MISNNKQRVKKIVLTGGPGAGKSTSLPFLKEEFEKEGYKVLVVPETATELILSGTAPWTLPSNLAFQEILLKRQLEKEAEVDRYITDHPDEKILVLLDRGIPDNQAFMDPKEYQEILRKAGLSEKEALERYDAVVHLESPARIYPEVYTLENNPARKHNANQSIELDQALLKSWQPHPVKGFVEASKDFSDKKNQLKDKINSLI